MAKIKKLKKGRGDSAVLENDKSSVTEDSDDEDDDDAALTGVSSTDDEEDEGDEEKAPVPAKISAKGRRKATSLVQITMLRTLPCPKIGNDDLLAITGVTHLKQSESYFVPENAANVLADRKAAIINGK